MPTLILLPGLHGTAELFDPFLKFLPPCIPNRTISYSTRHFSAPKLLLARLASELQNERDMILLAESFSGPLALEYANKYPDRVRAVVLCCSFVRPPVPRGLCYLAGIPLLLQCPIPSFAIRVFLAGSRAPKSLVKETRREIRANNPLVLWHRIVQAAWINAVAALKACPVPILCLAGSRDRLIGERAVRRIRRARPDVPIRMIDAPHLLLQTAPRAAWKAICAFGPIAECWGKVEAAR
jgi:pimeloyl-[acyl-carrier protein] methyl ester esterase